VYATIVNEMALLRLTPLAGQNVFGPFLFLVDPYADAN
jgi:hypothetical protein